MEHMSSPKARFSVPARYNHLDTRILITRLIGE
jgi:hypothetical protein